MPGVYNPALGVHSFQEFEGSVREEYIDGEHRIIRTFVGQGDKKDEFLNYIFGLEKVVIDASDLENITSCRQICSPIKPHRTTAAPLICPEGGSIIYHAEMVEFPYAFRMEPLSSDAAPVVATNVSVPLDPSEIIEQHMHCLVKIEVEYRPGLQCAFDPDITGPKGNNFWPYAIHDQFGGPVDVPDIGTDENDNRYFTYEVEDSIESKTLPNREFAYASYGTGGTAQFPSDTGAKGNVVEDDELHPIVNISVRELKLTVYNCPWVDQDALLAAQGKVNNAVFFGFPAHGVLFASYKVNLRTYAFPSFKYDVELVFVAKTVPAMGELGNELWPSSMPHMVWRDRIGVYNRAWWENVIPGTFQHWWPIATRNEAVFDAVSPDIDYLPYLETDLIAVFDALTTDVCLPA